jgi:hypothetical protein
MNITLIWFPLFKFAITVFLIWMAYYFFKAKKNKWGIWYIIVLILFWYFMPLKYDGTNIKEFHKTSQNQRDIEYKYISNEATIVKTVKKSFEEIMAEENNRSKKANIEIQNEINRNSSEEK